MKYVWLKDEIPIIEQVPKEYEFVAILLNPFIRMPLDWIDVKKSTSPECLYPTKDEILKLGEPVSWNEIVDICGFRSYQLVLLALKSSILSLNGDHSRNDLADLLQNNLPEEIFYPDPDSISEFIIKNLYQNIFSETIDYENPIFGENIRIQLSKVSISELVEKYSHECILSDEMNKISFMSKFDSFITLLLSTKNAQEVINDLKLEAIICNEKTRINWYLEEN